MNEAFHTWINGNWQTEFGELRSYINGRAGQWRFVAGVEQGFDLVDQDSSLTEVQKAEVRRQLARAFEAFAAETSRKSRGGGINAFGVGVFLFMGATILILAGAIFEPTIVAALLGNAVEAKPLLTRLADVQTARGLITFVFTVGVIALALIIVTANVTAGDGDGKRFERSKEILTSLVAILGTILGFYFGKSDSPPPPVADPAGLEADIISVAPASDPAADPASDPAAEDVAPEDAGPLPGE